MERFFKLFIKEKDEEKIRQKYGELSAIAGVGFNVILFVIKLIAGFITSSIGVMADALNNLSDAGSSIITFIGFKLSGKPADHEHPFGHGRVEYISALLVCVLIILMGFELLKASVDKIINPVDINFGIISVIILIISALIKLYMFYYNDKIGKNIDSEAMRATAKDSLSDFISTVAIILGLFVSHFLKINVDGYLGVLVSVFILYTGVKTIKESLSPLLGVVPSEELVRQIEDIVNSRSEVIGFHDLVIHNYGPTRFFVCLHVEVDAQGDMNVLHDIIDLIEREIAQKLSCQATIHMDPIAVNDVDYEILKGIATKAATSVDDRITIHDFRMVKGPTHTNLIFDAVLPYEFKISDAEFKDLMAKKIKEVDDSLYAVIDIDRSYI